MSRAKRQRSPFFWAKAAILSAGMLALAWLIVSASAVRSMPPHLLDRLGIPDTTPRTRFKQAEQQLVQNRGQLPGADYAALIAIANEVPLASEPFVFAGFQTLAANDIGRAEQLFAEARRRNPRLPAARLALISIYLNTDRPGPAGQEIAATIRTVPGSANVLIDELVRISQNPASRRALAAAIGDDPLMAEVLNRLVRTDAAPDAILELAARQPPAADGRFAPWQSRIVEMMIDRGELARARQLWRGFARAEEQAGGLLYDPEFRGLPGGPPFNWVYASNEIGSAERSASGGLDVDFFGRRSGQLVSQLLTLAPGSYQLAFRAEGSANGQGAQLVWRIACRGGAGLVELPLGNVTYSPQDFSRNFVVPAGGCPAQTIELVGVAGEYPAQQTARITGLTLRPGGTAR